MVNCVFRKTSTYHNGIEYFTCVFFVCIACGETFSLVPRSMSNDKVTFFKKCLLQGHSYFTNTSCFSCVFQITKKLQQALQQVENS